MITYKMLYKIQGLGRKKTFQAKNKDKLSIKEKYCLEKRSAKDF